MKYDHAHKMHMLGTTDWFVDARDFVIFCVSSTNSFICAINMLTDCIWCCWTNWVVERMYLLKTMRLFVDKVMFADNKEISLLSN